MEFDKARFLEMDDECDQALMLAQLSPLEQLKLYLDPNLSGDLAEAFDESFPDGLEIGFQGHSARVGEGDFYSSPDSYFADEFCFDGIDTSAINIIAIDRLQMHYTGYVQSVDRGGWLWNALKSCHTCTEMNIRMVDSLQELASSEEVLWIETIPIGMSIYAERGNFKLFIPSQVSAFTNDSESEHISKKLTIESNAHLPPDEAEALFDSYITNTRSPASAGSASVAGLDFSIQATKKLIQQGCTLIDVDDLRRDEPGGWPWWANSLFCEDTIIVQIDSVRVPDMDWLYD